MDRNGSTVPNTSPSSNTARYSAVITASQLMVSPHDG
jgi:hypothetical protein